ncbi:(2Fe-2S)-binding protein [Limnohabitans sp.]|uniref:(2Fe-2S)-binding protein n=1 Tax=Limnohabitans sp. TaxID=1907725 RepID=UPI0038BD0CFB
MSQVGLNVNGIQQKIGSSNDTPLLWVLRDELKLTGTKFGCGASLCGACTVLIDGIPSRSCQRPVSTLSDQRIETIEGLVGKEADAIRAAWRELNVVQCGWCQSGQIVAATSLLKKSPAPSDLQIDQAMSGNLCRCGTYPRIKKAIHLAAQTLKRMGQ